MSNSKMSNSKMPPTSTAGMLHVYNLVTMPGTTEPAPDVTFDPPVSVGGGTITKMTCGRYANRRIGIRLLGPDPDCGGAEAPYATLSHNVPGVTLSSPSHFFVDARASALADAIVATGHIEKLTSGKPCPSCQTLYVPKYKTLAEAQAADPGSIFAEQHISGVCSDTCWDDACKPDDY